MKVKLNLSKFVEYREKAMLRRKCVALDVI
jgi:hypothetical protein